MCRISVRNTSAGKGMKKNLFFQNFFPSRCVIFSKRRKNKGLGPAKRWHFSRSYPPIQKLFYFKPL